MCCDFYWSKPTLWGLVVVKVPCGNDWDYDSYLRKIDVQMVENGDQWDSNFLFLVCFCNLLLI